MKIFFDTETTGLLDYKKPYYDDTQPDLVQFAAILTEDDGTIRTTLSFIVNPVDFTIPTEASKVHGITNEIAKEYGISLTPELVTVLSNMFNKANTLVAHNYTYDKSIMNKLFFKYALKPLDDIKSYCTKEATTDICELPFSPETKWWPSRPKYKWPTCQEAYKHFFGEEFKGAHDALNDVRACMAVYFELERKAALA